MAVLPVNSTTVPGNAAPTAPTAAPTEEYQLYVYYSAPEIVTYIGNSSLAWVLLSARQFGSGAPSFSSVNRNHEYINTTNGDRYVGDGAGAWLVFTPSSTYTPGGGY